MNRDQSENSNQAVESPETSENAKGCKAGGNRQIEKEIKALSLQGFCDVRMVGDAIVVKFAKGLLRDKGKLGRILEKLIAIAGFQKGLGIVLDFEEVEYLSSCEIGQVLRLLKRSKAAEGILKLCNVQDSLSEGFDLMCLTEVFDINDTFEDALQQLENLGVVRIDESMVEGTG